MTDAPQRIQRQRTKGWRMPENTIYVGRGSRWGNPFRVGQEYMPAVHVHEVTAVKVGRMTRFEVDGRVGIPLIKFDGPLSLAQTISRFRGHVLEQISAPEIRKHLRGKNLACWCPPGEPCHADVLLEIANAPEASVT